MDIFSYLLGKKAGGGGTANLQSKEVTITQNGETTIQADEGYDGLSSVALTTNVPSEKPEYQELQYLTSDKRQYIDTGVKPNANTKIYYNTFNSCYVSIWHTSIIRITPLLFGSFYIKKKTYLV